MRVGRRGMRNRAGFTLVELLTVIVLLGALAAIAVPHYTGAARAADATSVIADFHAVQLAGIMHFTAKGTYPQTRAAATVPPELVPYLPDGFVFEYNGGVVTYRWRRWGNPDGTANDNSHPMVVGLEVQSNDGNLMAAIQNHFRGAQTIQNKQKTTFVIQ